MPVHHDSRPADTSERSLMRSVTRENGASLRLPWAWFRQATKLVLIWPLAWFLCGAMVMFMALPLWIVINALRPLFDPGTWASVEINLFNSFVALTFGGVPVFSLNSYCPIVAGEFP